MCPVPAGRFRCNEEYVSIDINFSQVLQERRVKGRSALLIDLQSLLKRSVLHGYNNKKKLYAKVDGTVTVKGGVRLRLR